MAQNEGTKSHLPDLYWLSMTSNSHRDYDIRPINFRRSLVVDAGYLSHKRHIIHGLLEVDITKARQLIRKYNISEGHNTNNPKLSFTAFMVASFARAIAQNPSVQALSDVRGWCCLRRNQQQVVFRNVDVVTMIEPAVGDVAIPHVIREANLKTVIDITKEIREVQNNPSTSEQQGGAIDVAAKLPRWTRMLAYKWFRRNPHRFRKMQGTAMLTSVGMFGHDCGGYAIGFLTVHTLGLTVGGISRRPGYSHNTNNDTSTADEVEPREYLNVTLSFDHDVVDGAPAARFAKCLVDRLQSAEALESLEHSASTRDDNAMIVDHCHSE